MIEHLNSFSKLEFDKVRQHIQRYAVSDLGRERVADLAPSSSLTEITTRLALVTEMKRLITSDEPLPMLSIRDVRTSLHRASIAEYVLTPEELFAVANVLSVTKQIKGYFTRRKSAYPLLSERVELIQLDKILEYNITQAIDEESRLRDNASKELSTVRRQMADRAASLRGRLERLLKSVAENEWTQEDIITTRDGRMVIPLKTEHKNRVPGFIHSSSASGATVFIEPTETLDLNNEIRTLQFREQREIERILRELTSQVAGSKDLILQNMTVFGELDFNYSKAQYSIEILGAEPAIAESGATTLIGAYHPLLLHSHARKDVVPLSVVMGGETNTIVITGPNAGGKSVAMKCVGLTTLLAHAGCHIPASSESVVNVRTDLFVEMGDEQSIENDLSSFSSHLSNLKHILQHVNATSLILIDEIGSGTDPAEGASIAAAILELLTASGATTIVTTHHGALKSFAFETPRVENAAMEFDQSTLTPTYRLRVGAPGSSYAIEMAERLALPPEMIARAKELRGSVAMKLENLIEDLERRNQSLSRELDAASAEKLKFNELNLLYESKLTSLREELKRVKAKALDEAQLIVEKANVAIEKAVREIREHSAASSVVKSTKQNVREIDAEIRKMREEFSEAGPSISAFSVGDTVRLRESNSSGEIVSQVDKNHFLVVAGDLRIKVHAKELLPAQRASAPARQYQTVDYLKEGKREIDLRGLYGEEAIAAIDKFFDESVLSGVTKVNLIHGKGTGALRRKVEEYLKKHSSVKSYRLGEWNEGGGGVTVVELV